MTWTTTWKPVDGERDRWAIPTRRERIATAALHGLLAGMTPEKEAVRAAIKLADALIAELDKDEKR